MEKGPIVKYDKTISRRELEVSIAWAKTHPEYFLKAIKKFRASVTGMPNFKIDSSRKGFVTYEAWI